MKWNQYLEDVLKENKYLDEIKVEINGQVTEMPSIVKASVFLHELMEEKQGKKNIFVFPDGEQIPFLLMLSELIYGIQSGKTENGYSPDEFEKGQLLKLGNCVMEFVGVEYLSFEPNVKRIALKFADCNKVSMPISKVPFLQKTDTKMKLSKKAAFTQEVKKIEETKASGENSLTDLKALMTHVNEALFYVGYVSNSERLANTILINGEKLFDYFFVAKADYTGELKSYPGKFTGTPSLVFSSQSSYVSEALNRGVKARAAIINLTENDYESELDAIDDLIQRKIPILCITDTANSFNLKELKNRGFNVWRWDEDSISDVLLQNISISSEKKLDKCVKASVVYHSLKAPYISDGFSRLYKYNRLVENESVQINSIFNKLLSMAYSTVRNICETSAEEKEKQISILDNCANALEVEKDFISTELYKDFEKTINAYYKVFESKDLYPKNEELYALLLDRRWPSFYLICSNGDDLAQVQQYWRNKLAKSGYLPQIKAIYAKEFINLDVSSINVAIVSGWINSNMLRKIIYGYKVDEIHVLTYECEERWKRAHTRSWKLGLSNSDNKIIAEKSFNKSISDIKIIADRENLTQLDVEEQETLIQQDDIDILVQENKYRQYSSRGNYSANEVVNAKPVGFAGGDFSLYTQNHKVLVVTSIIMQSANRIDKKDVESLKVGDFIVVREASKDIIREVADAILSAEGKESYRSTASLWKESLRIEESFSSLESICYRLAEAGCKRDQMTMRNWVLSDDIIIPSDKEDLRIIASITGDEVLMEMIDEIYEKGMVVRNAHIKAGRVLSDRLAESIGAKLLSGEKIDPYNIWDPIELEIKDVGAVKILKIIDIASNWISVNLYDTNKVLSEEKEELLWQE